MNPGGGGALYPDPPDFDGEPRYDRLDDSRLLDAAETLVTLQTSDLGASNNPLFGSNNQPVNGLGAGHPVEGNFGRGEGGLPAQYMVVGRSEGEGGRGRGKRGPSKRGKKKAAGGEGRGSGQLGGGGLGGLPGEQGSEDGGQQQVVFNDMGSELNDPSAIAPPLRPAEMFKVGPLSLSHTVLDDILSEKKAQLLEDPDIVEFLRQHGGK